MARKRRGDQVDGWLVLDKPFEMGSTAALAKARRIFNANKAGHGGTLDPLATGLLPIAFGEATKTVSFVMDGRKAYRFTVRWGKATETDDAEGKVIATSDVRPEPEAIRAILSCFIGSLQQTPPLYSAIKVQGARAYDLARDGKTPEMKPREVEIYDLQLEAVVDADHAVFSAECGKGTYIRSLARDLAVALGTVGHVATLRRTRCGPFTENDAISLDKLMSLGHSARASGLLHSVVTVLDDIPALALTEYEAHQLHHGQFLDLLPILQRSNCIGVIDGSVDQNIIVRAMCGKRLVAIARAEADQLKPVRIIHTNS